MTPAEAQAVQDAARERGEWIMWFVSTSHSDRPGRAFAWAVIGAPGEGTHVPEVMVADTLDELGPEPEFTGTDSVSTIDALVGGVKGFNNRS